MPPVIVTPPPAPPSRMVPAKVPLALVKVSVLAPRFTAPKILVPERLLIETPPPARDMSKVPSLITAFEDAMLPPLVRSSWPPPLIVVSPV